jgi:GGDEF domain-containing protein
MIKKTGITLKNVPDIPVLHQMLSQSLQKPGEKLVATWRNNEKLLFTLELVCSLKDRDPRWLLICEKSGKRSVVSQISGHDVLLIYKQISTAASSANEVVSRAEEAENAIRLAKSSDNHPALTKSDMTLSSSGGLGGGTPGNQAPSAPAKPSSSTSVNISAPARTRQLPFALIGKIAEISLPKLLQVIGSEKMTGLLQLEEEGNTASLFIQEGHPIEAKLLDTEGELAGDSAFAEIMYWTEANYTFKVGATTSTRNLVKSSEILLEHVRPLAQVLEELTKRGMTADSVFKHAHQNLTGEQFTAKATADAPVDMEALASLYLRLDGDSTMSDLENVQILPRPLLVRSIHHLIACDIITFINKVEAKPEIKPVIKPASQPALAKSPHPDKASHPDKTAAPPLPPLNAQQQRAQAMSAPMAQPAQPARPAPVAQSVKPIPLTQTTQPKQTPTTPLAQPTKVGPPTKPVVKPKNIDGAAIQSVMMSLRREDTGLFIHPAFLYFLEEEFFRIYRAKGAMSIIIFEIREVVKVDGAVRRKPLPIEAIADATIRINSKKRHTDIVAHYEAYDFGILLPSTKCNGTKVFVQKIIKTLMEKPLAGTEGKQLSYAFGSASIPEDFTDINSLLGAAEMSMHYARDRGEQIIFFKDLLV